MRGGLSRAIGGDPVAEEGARFGRRELKVLYPHLRPDVKLALASVGLLVVAQAGALAAPLLIRYGLDRGVVQQDTGALTWSVIMLAAATVVNWLALRSSVLLGGKFGERSLRSIRVRVFDHMAHLDLGFFEREKAGRLVARLTSDVETIQLLVTEGLVQMVATFMYLIGSVAVLFYMDWRLAAVSLLAAVPPMIAATLVFRIHSERVYRRVRDRIAAVLSFMQETVRGVQVVQAFGREGHNASRFRQVNMDWRVANVDSFRPGSVFFPLVEFVGLIGQAVVLIYGGWQVTQGNVSVGVLAAFVLYLSTTLDPILHLSQLYDTFQQAMAGLAKLAGLLSTKATVVEADGARQLNGAKGAAAVDDVTFHYRDDLPEAVRDIHLDVAPGEVLALVGPTGAGKSTIAKLILRFYDPTTGRITLDGLNLRELTMASLRRAVSMVPQEGFLFRGTIRDNIRFGRPDASDEDVEEVCRLLGIHDTISELREGYDTEVRERGAALSGGERQLLAVARAMLADPKLLVLDEATSALDAGTESRVEQALRTATTGRTTIVIAHRLSTASRADKIAVVDQGRVVEFGTHDDLVSRAEGLYARLYQHWLAGSGSVDAAMTGLEDRPATQ